jgi:hypothetical protein
MVPPRSTREAACYERFSSMTASTEGEDEMKFTKIVLASVAALAITGSAMSTAQAQPNGDAPAKKGCEVQLKGPGAGQSIVYEHGYSFSIQDKSTGKTHTYKCNDGKWEETVSLKAPGSTRFGAVNTAVGTVQVLSSGKARFSGRTAPAGGKYSAVRANR